MGTIERRKSAEGDVSFRAKVRIQGHAPVTRTFSKVTEARHWIQQTEVGLRRTRPDLREYTVSEAIDRYVGSVLPRKPKSYAVQRQQLEWWKSKVGTLPLTKLTSARLVECREELERGVTQYGSPRKPATVNRYLAVISHLLSVAVREWEWLDVSPFSRVRKLKEPRGRDRYLTRKECDALLSAAKASPNKDLHLIILLALTTGMRRGEILGLRWKDIDLETGRIYIRDSKNGEARTISLPQSAGLALFKRHDVAASDNPYLFCSGSSSRPLQDIKRSWTAILDKCGIANFRFHDLRHTAASYLAMENVSPRTIAEVLGHKTMSMVKRYSHLSEAHLKGALEKLEFAILSEVTDEQRRDS